MTLCVAGVILALRKPDMVTNPQFWAEDGPLFYEQAMRLGSAAVLVPYASYLHFVPRLAALLATHLDPLLAPATFVAVAFLCTLYTAARTQSARCPLPHKAAFALAVVLVPDAFETLLNLANLQWILFAALLLVLISADAKHPGQKLHDAIAVILFGLTGPFSILLAPLFVWRAVIRRSPISTVLALLASATAGIQLWTVCHNPPGSSAAAIVWSAVPAVPGMRITASLLLGYRVPMDFSRPIEVLLGVIGVGSVVLLSIQRGAMRLERIWLGAAFLFVLASSLFRCRAVLVHLCHAGYGARYFYPLQLITVWLLLVVVFEGRRWLARTTAAVVLWSLVINLPRLREPRLTDLHWSSYAAKIRSGAAVSIPTNPAPWTVNLPAKTERR